MTNGLLAVLILTNIGMLALLLLKKDKGAVPGDRLGSLEKNQERLESVYKDEMSRSRAEAAESDKRVREEVMQSVKAFGDSVDKRLFDLTNSQFKNFERVRGAIDKQLELLRKDNSGKLEEMRVTVDEKLHATLEKRLGESFKQVSDRLEQVHKGLGEMQVLATGVGDLKKVLTNVKTRGTWGEVQLGSLLDQIMTPNQYDKNVATRSGSSERVEFAIKIPSKGDDQKTIWLPIDAKFPVEDYHRLTSAREAGDTAAMEQASKELENRIKLEAKKIQEKYVQPPETTDFAILYLPTEGLYAEITQRPGLFDFLQGTHRVIVAGPNTVAAILSSLQMGFRTLAIEKRSSEVWNILGAVKTEFGKFGGLLEKTQKQLQTVSNTIESAASKSRTIERKLEKVHDLPQPEQASLLESAVETPLRIDIDETADLDEVRF